MSSRRPINRQWFAVPGLLAWCGFLCFYGSNTGELYRTESLRAIIAAECLRGGSWLVPTLYGQPFFTKPPGMYVAIALVSWPLGEVREWTARLPSALAATATVLLVYWYFHRQLGFLGGLTAALVLPISFMWLDKAPAAEIDMLQTFWVTASILLLLRALEGETGGGAWWLASMLCVAGGILTKWTAPAFFYGTAVTLLWRRGQLRLLWSRNHLLSAALGAGICLAWAATAIGWAGWDAFYGTVRQEALTHLSAGHNYRPPGYHRRMEPWLEILVHPARVLGASLPVALFALPALWPGFARLWDERGQRLWQALHCWAWPNLLFWSLVPEHGIRHCLPLYPAIAGLAAMVWTAWLSRRLPWRWQAFSPRTALVAILVCWIVVKVFFVEVAIPRRGGTREPRLKGEQISARVPSGMTLYLFRLKDEGIMFYYGRPVRRLAEPAHLPSSSEPLYCMVVEDEWRQWPASRNAETLLALTDEQGAPIRLVRTDSATPRKGFGRE